MSGPGLVQRCHKEYPNSPSSDFMARVLLILCSAGFPPSLAGRSQRPPLEPPAATGGSAFLAPKMQPDPKGRNCPALSLHALRVEARHQDLRLVWDARRQVADCAGGLAPIVVRLHSARRRCSRRARTRRKRIWKARGPAPKARSRTSHGHVVATTSVSAWPSCAAQMTSRIVASFAP